MGVQRSELSLSLHPSQRRKLQINAPTLCREAGELLFQIGRRVCDASSDVELQTGIVGTSDVITKTLVSAKSLGAGDAGVSFWEARTGGSKPLLGRRSRAPAKKSAVPGFELLGQPTVPPRGLGVG